MPAPAAGKMQQNENNRRESLRCMVHAVASSQILSLFNNGCGIFFFLFSRGMVFVDAEYFSGDGRLFDLTCRGGCLLQFVLVNKGKS